MRLGISSFAYGWAVGIPGYPPLRPLRAVEVVERAGVCLALENFETFKAAELADMLGRIGGEMVGVCLDTVNSVGALEGPEVVVKALAPLTVNLHVKDYTIRRMDHRLGFVIEGRPAGQGQLDIPCLLESVRDNGHDPSVILEQWTPPGRTVADTIAVEERWAAESVRYMRALLPG